MPPVSACLARQGLYAGKSTKHLILVCEGLVSGLGLVLGMDSALVVLQILRAGRLGGLEQLPGIPRALGVPAPSASRISAFNEQGN